MALFAPETTQSNPIFANPAATTIEASNPFVPGHWTHRIIPRMVIGYCIIAVLHFSLWALVKGCVAALQGPQLINDWSLSFWGYVANQACMCFAIMIGCMLSGAGKERAGSFGLFTAILYGFSHIFFGQFMASIDYNILILQPLWAAVFGTIGGNMGESIWHPPIARSKSSASASDSVGLVTRITLSLKAFAFAKLPWWKIILASFIIMFGVFNARLIMEYFLRTTGLNLVDDINLRRPHLVLLLQFLIVFFSSVFAGVGSPHGFASGFWTGLIGSIGFMLLNVFFPDPKNPLEPNVVLMFIGGIFVLAVVGGILGASVAPPISVLAEENFRRRILKKNLMRSNFAEKG